MSMGQQMTITKLVFTPTGTYNAMQQRPFALSGNYDTSSVAMLQQATNGGNSISAGTLAPYAGQLLRPGADLCTAIQIANGWDTPRLRFMMEIKIRMMGGEITQYCSGYTDYAGISDHGMSKCNIDPNMKLYFNSVVSLQSVRHDIGNGQIGERTTMMDASHILSGQYNPGFGGSANGVTALTTRPEDIFSVIQIASQGGYTPYLDARLTFGDNTPKRSSRRNEVPNQYMANVMGGYHTALHSSMDANDDLGTAMDLAIGRCTEASLLDNPLFFAISNRIGFNEGSSVSYGNLCMLADDLDSRTQVPRGLAPGAMPLHGCGQSSNWNVATMETVAAHTLVTQTPAIMSDLLLTKVLFTATNNTFGGNYEVDLINYESFARGVDMAPYLSAFISRVTSEILVALSNNRLINFNFRVMLDMYGETHVWVSMMGNNEEYYCLPSFADALIVPLMSFDINHVMGLASDFEVLTNNLDIPNMQPQGVIYHGPGSI